MLSSNLITTEYMSVKEVSEICAISMRTLRDRIAKNKYAYRVVASNKGGGNKGKSFEILITSLEDELQGKIREYLLKSLDTHTEVDAVKNQQKFLGTRGEASQGIDGSSMHIEYP